MPEMAPGPVFAGRAAVEAGPHPVLDDPTVIRERSWLKGPDQAQPAKPSLGVRAGVFVILMVVATLVGALAMALATR